MKRRKLLRENRFEMQSIRWDRRHENTLIKVLKRIENEFYKKFTEAKFKHLDLLNMKMTGTQVTEEKRGAWKLLATIFDDKVVEIEIEEGNRKISFRGKDGSFDDAMKTADEKLRSP